uniref:Partitioning defective 3 B n=1 Tax=Sphaerodactylus townsendi TaxID=933632 RepID=A0ACB8G1D1_9SAUR
MELPLFSLQVTTLHGPVEPVEYLTGLRVAYKERDLPYYQGAQPAVHPSKASFSHPQDGPRATELWYPQYYPPQPVAQHKGPLRQDVPPSPTQSHRVLPYNEMGRTGHRRASPDQYPYRHQDPRQKDPMTAAV